MGYQLFSSQTHHVRLRANLHVHECVRLSRHYLAYTKRTPVIGAILQWRVYELSPCGYSASKCTIGTGVSPLSLWSQLPLYGLPGIAGVFINVTGYELSINLAPQRMKAVIFAAQLFFVALASAAAAAASPSFHDPHL